MSGVLHGCGILFLEIAERHVKAVFEDVIACGNSMVWIHSATQQSFFETHGKTDDALMPPVEGPVSARTKLAKKPSGPP